MKKFLFSVLVLFFALTAAACARGVTGTYVCKVPESGNITDAFTVTLTLKTNGKFTIKRKYDNKDLDNIFSSYEGTYEVENDDNGKAAKITLRYRTYSDVDEGVETTKLVTVAENGDLKLRFFDVGLILKKK